MTGRSERWAAVFLFGLAIVYLVGTRTFTASFVRTTTDARLFPIIIGIGILLLSIVLFVQDLVRARIASGPSKQPSDDTGAEQVGSPGATPTSAAAWRRGTAVLAAMLLYPLLLERLGFIFTNTVFLYGVSRYLGYRRRLVALVVAVGFAVGVYVLFTDVFEYFLPTGTWMPTF